MKKLVYLETKKGRVLERWVYRSNIVTLIDRNGIISDTITYKNKFFVCIGDDTFQET